MKLSKVFVPFVAMGMVVFADVSFAAFGGARGSSGVSRSYSRPATPTYSKPASTYKAPSYTPSRQAPSQSYGSSSSYSNKSSYNSGYSNSGYNSNSNYRRDSYPEPVRQSSVGRDIAVTAAGVGGGILAAQAITALVSSPGHPGMYTHPQYPGQYFNQAGVPMPAPVQQAPQVAPSQYEAPPTQAYLQPQSQQPAPVVVYQAPQPKDDGLTFFGFLWGSLWWLIKLAFFLSVVGALGYGVYKLIQLARRKDVRDQVSQAVNQKLDFTPKGPSDLEDLDSKAMDIFYAFQKNSDNREWVEANTKYLPVEDCLAAPSRVLAYQHITTDCAVEQGKTRGTVKYEATLDDGTGKVFVAQYWNFEKDNGTWKLIGIEQDD